MQGLEENASGKKVEKRGTQFAAIYLQPPRIGHWETPPV
jgi:hypothetical protein